MPSRQTISLSLYKGQARIYPGVKLDTFRFDTYTHAAREGGATYDAALGAMVCSPLSVENVVRSLSAYGFQPVVADQLFKLVESLGPSKIQTAAKEWVDELIAELAPRQLAPRQFQIYGIKFLRSRKNALLLDDMGCGKTIQYLCALPRNAPVIVLCPKVAKRNVANEVAIWRPEFRTTIISGRAKFRRPLPGEIIICNYESLPKAEILRKNAKWGIAGAKHYQLVQSTEIYDIDTQQRIHLPLDITMLPGTHLIADEIHKVKSPKAMRSRSLKALARLVRNADGSLWGATGTPLLNHPAEFWNLLDVFDLKEEAFGSWSTFFRLFGGVRGGGFRGAISWNPPSKPSAEIVECMRRVSIMRKLDDVAPEIPKKTRISLKVEIDKATKDQCDKVVADLAARGISLDEAIQRSIEYGQEPPGFAELARARALLAAAKTPFMMEHVENFEEQDTKLLVFSAHRTPIELLGKRDGWDVIMGGVSEKKRSQVIKDFQAEGSKKKGVGLTITAGGIAVTLTAASYVMFVDRLYSPMDNLQAENRVHRIGQKRPQFIYDLVADHPIDERCYEICMEKIRMIENTVDASKIVGEPDDQNASIDPVATLLGSGVIVADPKKHKMAAQSPRHAPKTPAERWAASGLRKLAALDPDRAAEANRVGFDALDSPIGHSLASKLGIGLTDAEWARAIVMLKKYRDQIGTIDAFK